MLLGEPPRTKYDIEFSIFGFPVRVHPFFFLLTALLGASSGNIYHILIWMVVVFLSILVHELGHAFAMRYFGSNARIVLYAMGGLAISEDSWNVRGRRTNPNSSIIISAAGPIAGFILAFMIIAAIKATGGSFWFTFEGLVFWQFDLNQRAAEITSLSSMPTASFALRIVVHYALLVNILFGLLNCLPIYPLDGGQIARELFTRSDGWNGTRKSSILSAVTGGVIAVLALMTKNMFIAFMFGFLAYQSWQAAQNIGGGGGFGGGGFGGGGRRPW